MILNQSFLGILVSMLKKEKWKVQEAKAQLAKFTGSQSSFQSSSSSTHAEKRFKHEASEDSIHAEHVKCKQNGERSNTLLQIFSALHHHIYIELTQKPTKCHCLIWRPDDTFGLNYERKDHCLTCLIFCVLFGNCSRLNSLFSLSHSHALHLLDSGHPFVLINKKVPWSSWKLNGMFTTSWISVYSTID